MRLLICHSQVSSLGRHLFRPFVHFHWLDDFPLSSHRSFSRIPIQGPASEVFPENLFFSASVCFDPMFFLHLQQIAFESGVLSHWMVLRPFGIHLAIEDLGLVIQEGWRAPTAGWRSPCCPRRASPRSPLSGGGGAHGSSLSHLGVRSRSGSALNPTGRIGVAWPP